MAFVIRTAYNAARDFYSIKAEVPAGKGFADLTFIPIADAGSHPPMVIELKSDCAEGGAMEQILKKKTMGTSCQVIMARSFLSTYTTTKTPKFTQVKSKKT